MTENHNSIYQFLESSKKTFEKIIICGGDGTVSSGLEEITKYQKGTLVCIYPIGSTNEFAKTLGITKQTLNNYLNGVYDTNHIDVGDFDGGIFSYSMTFGNFTHITYQTPQRLKNIFGHVAYSLYGFLHFIF